MDSLGNSFEINLTIREAKSSGRTPTIIHAEVGGTRVNISTTVPIVAEVYVETNSDRKELKLDSNSYKDHNGNESKYPQSSSTDNSTSRTKRSLDFQQPEAHSTRTKRSLDFKSDFKIFPMVTAINVHEPSSSNEHSHEYKKDTGPITYPYNYEKEYEKLKAKGLKLEREQMKKEQRQIKEYYKMHDKMLEGWQKMNDKQNSLWEKERERERARKEEYRKQREESEKKLHEERMRSIEKKKMQSQNVQNDKSKKDNEREKKTVN